MSLRQAKAAVGPELREHIASLCPKTDRLFLTNNMGIAPSAARLAATEPLPPMAAAAGAGPR